MNQNRGPPSTADVGRTGRKVTKLRVKCECKSLSQFGVQPVDLGVCCVQCEAGMESLEPEMVFLIQHESNRILHQQGGTRSNPAIGIQARKLLADQVPLMQQLPVGAVESIETELDSASK